MFLYLIIGISAGIIITLLFVFANSAKQIDIVKKPQLDAELTPAQLIIADVPYNVGTNFYGSNPMWYVGGGQ